MRLQDRGGPTDGTGVTIRPIHTTALAWVGYALLFPVLHATVVNDMAAALLLVPLMVTAWHHGRAGGWLGAGLALPLQITLFLLGEHELGWDVLAGVEGAVGLSSVLVTAVVAGHVVDRLRFAERDAGEKDRLVATVSHEVRNPLTGVIGLADALLEQWDEMDRDEARELVSLIGTEAHAMEAIVEDLLDFSRLSAGSISLEQEPVDLGTVARAVEPGATGSAYVTADAGRVAQIVRNLVSNAVRYGGSSVEVEAGTAGDTGWIEVRDDGDGVSPEVEPDVFTPFASSGVAGSTGLGLAVSRELARAMGGEVRYLRRAGWTVFRLDLPVERVTSGLTSGRRA
jgi:signal transduction histidine kinase